MADVDVQSMRERHAARRTFPLLARTKVCRNLFGAVEHEELSAELQQRLQEISLQNRSRWNFHFEQNQPLPGPYAWEEIPSSAAPAFYQESVISGRWRNGASLSPKESESAAEWGCGTEAHNRDETAETSASSTRELNQENRSGTLNAGKPAPPAPPARSKRRRTPAVPDSFKTDTTHITDFFPRRKRSIETKSTERTSPVGSSLSSEVTPRKRIR